MTVEVVVCMCACMPTHIHTCTQTHKPTHTGARAHTHSQSHDTELGKSDGYTHLLSQMSLVATSLLSKRKSKSLGDKAQNGNQKA